MTTRMIIVKATEGTGLDTNWIRNFIWQLKHLRSEIKHDRHRKDAKKFAVVEDRPIDPML